MDRKLYRDEYHKKIAGVCAGLAEYFNIDVAIVRVVFVLALIFHGGGGLIYIIFWIVLPKKPFFIDPTVDYRVPPQNPGDISNPYGGNPFGGNPFSNQPFPNQPFPAQPRNTTSLVAIIFGVILILIGGSILLNDFDILPDWDFEQLWPIILIVVGGALMLSGERKKPWENAGWDKGTATDAKPAEENTSEANPPADNPPTV
ncbi:PspC domain-containing protein [Mucilaginibacter sp. McL0603]|uniref:PspC domain-containing protein n=1 Tax=Mucilaginibacter sp. McL0603 TaxID=3415670 RepID=UPI003CEC8E5E